MHSGSTAAMSATGLDDPELNEQMNQASDIAIIDRIFPVYCNDHNGQKDNRQ